jgi:Mg-chelatase subunit ChlD
MNPDDVLEEEVKVMPVIKSIVRNNELLDKDYERLMRMSQVFGKFASMLSLRNIKVDVVTEYGQHTPDAPAWSDSNSISFRRDKLQRLDTPKAVTGLKGLSLHEIAHILLTPRDGTVLIKNVRSAKVWNAFNALEDMRIEMFMSTKYSNVKDWLTATIAQYLLKNTNEVKYQFPLVYGRKFLPVEIRTMVRDEYAKQDSIPELESLIDEYIVMNLADPANYKRATEIIIRYSEIIDSLSMDSSGNACEPSDDCSHGHYKGWDVTNNPNGHDNRKNAEWKPGNKSLTKQQQDAIAKRVNTNNGNGYSKSDPSSTPSDSTGGMSAGAGGATKDRVYRDTLEHVLQDVYSRKHEEIIDTIRQLNGEAKLNAKHVKAPERSEWIQQLSVDAEAVSISRSFGQELEQLKADYDPAWAKRVDAGRLNVGRYVTGCEVDEAFDLWEEGREDAVDIEAVVMLDVSGSMDWALRSSYQSMWSIKRALDKVNASTTVLTFGSQAELLYSSNERATTTMKYAGDGGGTEPKDAVNYAYSVLANSNRAIKLFIAITDGMWYNAELVDNQIRQLRKAGVLTALAYVVNPEYLERQAVDGQVNIGIDSHGCEIATNITNPRDLFILARKLVKTGVGRNLA